MAKLGHPAAHQDIGFHLLACSASKVKEEGDAKRRLKGGD